MPTNHLVNKTLPLPVSLAVQMLFLNLAFGQGNGTKFEEVKPLNTVRSWKLEGLVEALDQLTEEKLDTAHSIPHGYYNNLYGFNDGYETDKYYAGPAFVRDTDDKYEKVSFPNKPLFGSGYFPPQYPNQRANMDRYDGRFQTPQDAKYAFYYNRLYKPGYPKRFHYRAMNTNQYQDHINKNRPVAPHCNQCYPYKAGIPYNLGGYSQGASLYSNLLIPSYRNKQFIPTRKRTGVYVIPSPKKYYVDNVPMVKNVTMMSKPIDISTLVLGLSTIKPSEEIQLKNIKKSIK